jgi:hypothetical protein
LGEANIGHDFRSGGNVARIISFIVFSFSSFVLVQAQMELPPKITSQKELIRQARKIRLQVPEVYTSSSHAIENADTVPGEGVESYLQDEQKLVNRLRSSRQYMKEAATRPPLQLFLFEETSAKPRFEKVANTEWTRFLSENSSETYDQKRNLLETLELYGRWPMRSSANFFAGLSRLLKPEQRSLLAEPDLTKKWDSLRPILASLTVDELRGSFNAERFGLTKEKWNLRDLDDLFAEIRHIEERLLVLLQLEFSDGKPIPDIWFNRDVLVVSSIRNQPPLVGKLVVGLATRASKLYLENSKGLSDVRVERSLVLREVPPTLAIYRGCVGNDCSTAVPDSIFMSYSPMERTFWIEDILGNRLGYVGATVASAGKRRTLYLRDITGPKLSQSDLELIVKGFSQLTENYQVEQIAIAHVNFTSQNHFAEQQRTLINLGSKFGQAVPLKFLDRGIVQRYLDGGGAYDSSKMHRLVMALQISPSETAAIRVSPLENQKEEIDFAKTPARLWEVLTGAVTLNDPALLTEAFGDRKINWEKFVAVLRNESGLRVADFRASVKTAFKKYDLPYSANLAARFESLFFPGHMAARDFCEPENIRQTIRYLTDLLWRSPDPEAVKSYLSKNVSVFEENDQMNAAVKTLFTRQTADDLKRIQVLWESGFRFKNVDLTTSELIWAIDKINPGLILSVLRRKIDKAGGEVVASTLDPRFLDLLAIATERMRDEEPTFRVEYAKLLSQVAGITQVPMSQQWWRVRFAAREGEGPVAYALGLDYLHFEGVDGAYSPQIFKNILSQSTVANIPIELRRKGRAYVDSLDEGDLNRINERLRLELETTTRNLPLWYRPKFCEGMLAAG